MDYFNHFFHEGEKSVRLERRALLKKASSGDLTASYKLAKEAFKSGNHPLARKYFVKVIPGPSKDWMKACLYVGTIDFNANQYQGAEYYWKQAAENGETIAMNNLANLYLKEDNVANALYWLEKSSLKGNPRAKLLLNNLKKMPAPQFNVTPHDAEIIAAKWMRYWGYHDAKATPVGPDGGIDVVASKALAQVKYQKVKTSHPEINGFHGSAEGLGKDELFFSLAGYTQKALDRAEEKDIALFQFNSQGIPKPVNSVARRIARS